MSQHMGLITIFICFVLTMGSPLFLRPLLPVAGAVTTAAWMPEWLPGLGK